MAVVSSLEADLEVVTPVWKGGADRSAELRPPAAYLPAQPTFFLALGAASSYEFGVASPSGDENAAQQGIAWLRGALVDLGIGAKTAAGHGYWIIDQ
jgi:CRISPR/Cas system CMR subunit Cmr6 (Cas7 group RAMP superfamily)